jgi:hypothetical protein
MYDTGTELAANRLTYDHDEGIQVKEHVYNLTTVTTPGMITNSWLIANSSARYTFCVCSSVTFIKKTPPLRVAGAPSLFITTY